MGKTNAADHIHVKADSQNIYNIREKLSNIGNGLCTVCLIIWIHFPMYHDISLFGPYRSHFLSRKSFVSS